MNRLKGARGPIIGLLVGLITISLLNLASASFRVAIAQDEATPTPVGEESASTSTPTAAPTQTPSFQFATEVKLAAGGDVDSDGEINPGDTLSYTFTISNSGPNDAGPISVVASYDPAFASGVINISDGGAVGNEGQVVWFLNGLSSRAQRTLTYDLTLKRRFPSGINQVTAGVVVVAGTSELGRSTFPPLEVRGPNLGFAEVGFGFVTDVNRNTLYDPGDTVKIIITYRNVGGGPSNEASIVADYPDDLTAQVLSVSNPEIAVAAEGAVRWQIGSVPPDDEVRQVDFTVTLAPRFPAGVTSYDIPLTIRGATADLDTTVVSIPISGASVVLSPEFTFESDQNGNGFLDEGDIVNITITYQNVGTEAATAVLIRSEYVPSLLQIASVGQSGTFDAGAGVVTWPALETLSPGASGQITFRARVLVPPAGSDATVVRAISDSEQTAESAADLSLPLFATPAGTTVPSFQTETKPAQGQGILSSSVVGVLIGVFLSFSLLAIVFVASRVLPGSREEREEQDEEDRASQRRLVRELIEGVIITAILFSVMVMGLQNALDQDSVNSIIAGIVGYVAGRVASQK